MSSKTWDELFINLFLDMAPSAIWICIWDGQINRPFSDLIEFSFIYNLINLPKSWISKKIFIIHQNFDGHWPQVMWLQVWCSTR